MIYLVRMLKLLGYVSILPFLYMFIVLDILVYLPIMMIYLYVRYGDTNTPEMLHEKIFRRFS